MRHERISATNVAAWPVGIEPLVLVQHATNVAPGAEPAFAKPAAAVPDVAPGVGRLIVSAYVGLLTVLFAFFTGSALALFAVTIAAGFAVAFFTVPILFLKVEADRSRRPTFEGFLDHGMETLTGHCSGREALIQMLIVPVLLAFGLATMGIVGAVYL